MVERNETWEKSPRNESEEKEKEKKKSRESIDYLFVLVF